MISIVKVSVSDYRKWVSQYVLYYEYNYNSESLKSSIGNKSIWKHFAMSVPHSAEFWRKIKCIVSNKFEWCPSLLLYYFEIKYRASNLSYSELFSTKFNQIWDTFIKTRYYFSIFTLKYGKICIMIRIKYRLKSIMIHIVSLIRNDIQP